MPPADGYLQNWLSPQSASGSDHSDRQGGHPALLYKKRDQKISILLFCLPLLQEKSDLNLNTASTNLERRTIMSTIIRRFLEEEILVANH